MKSRTFDAGAEKLLNAIDLLHSLEASRESLLMEIEAYGDARAFAMIRTLAAATSKAVSPAVRRKMVEEMRAMLDRGGR